VSDVLREQKTDGSKTLCVKTIHWNERILFPQHRYVYIRERERERRGDRRKLPVVIN